MYKTKQHHLDESGTSVLLPIELRSLTFQTELSQVILHEIKLFIFVIVFFLECGHGVTLNGDGQASRREREPTLVMTTITGMPKDLVRTPSARGRTTCSSALACALVGVVADAMEADEADVAMRLAAVAPLFRVAIDAEDDIIDIDDESFGSA